MRRRLIPGVPFVGWHQARRLEFPDSDITNSSRPAAILMLHKYWADEPERSAPPEGLPPEPEGWRAEGGEARSIDDLKAPIDECLPILVSPGLTPIGHPVAFVGIAVFQDQRFGPHSGVLDTIVPYHMLFPPAPHLPPGGWLRESVFMADRVVIGYDDDREVLLLHDPKFGPAWEITYADFDKMWEPIGRRYGVVYPPDAAARLASRPPAEPYRPRTTEERAAEHFVFGYAHACAGQVTAARQHFRQGLALPGLDAGYRHLFLVELALLSAVGGDHPQAISMLEQALDLVPDHHRPWEGLAQLYRGHGRPIAALRSAWKAKRLARRGTAPFNFLPWP